MASAARRLAVARGGTGMTQFTMMMMSLACALAVLDWRQGLTLCVIVGVLQDPMRKLAPGQPIYYVVLVGVVFAAAWVRAALLRVPLGPSVIYGWRESLKAPFAIFLAVVLFQALHSFTAYGSFKLTGIGLLVWLAPVPAIILAYQFVLRGGLRVVRRWMLLYIVATLIALSGVYLEYAGFGGRLLGEIGEGQIIYDVGTVLKAHSGFFRASEIAAWHTATVACFVFILSLGKRPTVVRIAGAVLLVAMLVTLGLLTGRRKMLVEVTIFISAYLFLFAWVEKGMFRLAMSVLTIGVVGYVAIVGFVAPDLVQSSYSKQMKLQDASAFQGYAERGKSVFADLPDRVRGFGIEPVVAAVNDFGWLGAGLGTGSQGTNDIAEQHNINRWASEGGLGKIAMELGVPGLAAVAWMVYCLGRYLRRELAVLAKLSPQHARLAFGFLSFLIANIATFAVATQAYSDLFVLLILGWSLGFLLAMPALAARAVASDPRSQPWALASTAVVHGTRA
jgi:hypothetical protein